MKLVTLIEPSPTLRFGLNRLLQHHQFHVRSYGHGYEFFEHFDIQPDLTTDLIVVGWPSRSEAEQSLLIKLLSQPGLAKTPLLIFARHMDENNLESFADRSNCVIQLWKDYRDSIPVIEQLSSHSVRLEKSSVIAKDTNAIRVLLVDDSKSARTIYSKQLEKLSCEVIVAEDAKQGWELLQQHPIDIAIIDYFMPGMNGAMLCQRIAESEEYQHVIRAVLTGTYKEEVIEECIRSGARECMFKNEAMSLFSARVQSMIQQIRGQQLIRAQKQEVESILSSVGEGIYGVDHEGRFIFINPAALQLLNVSSSDELIGELAHETIHHSDEFGRRLSDEFNYLYQAYQLREELRDWETLFWTTDNQPIPVECTARPLNQDDQTRGTVVVFKNIAERKLLEDEINWQLNHDHLTQLLNRSYFEQLLEQEIRFVESKKKSSALLYIDLDNFKLVNDQAGHLAGDQLLISISEKIRSRLRKKDLGARLSGDEFAILLHDVKSKDLENLANNYREMLQNTHFNYEGRDYSVSGSIGAALITDQATSKKELLNAADYACQQAKQQGKNQVFICSNPNDAKMSHQQSGWHNKIQTALEDQSFKLMFQPIYAMSKLDTLHLRDLNDTKKTEWLTSYCRPSQFECFVRLKNTDGKIIMPGAFISDAERFDLMASIDLWVLERTFSTLKRLSFKPTINVNVSASTLLDSNASQKLLTLIHENSGLCNYLQLEIKEHHLLHYREMLIPVLETLADLGCRLQVDDFGRNFSLFSKLRELPISGIKIDGLFTQNIAWDPVDRKLMHSMAEVARSSDIVVTVKAIETYEALESLEQGGIDFVQGHWLSYPHETLLLNQY